MICSMNAPVMVELSGETDPLQVRLHSEICLRQVEWILGLIKELANLDIVLRAKYHVLTVLVTMNFHTVYETGQS